MTPDNLCNISSVRRKTYTSFPRHTTLTISPGSSDPNGTSTGAPRALALALGLNDYKNGTAAKAIPAEPVTAVAIVRK